MLTPEESRLIANIASMSAHHGSYCWLCDVDGQPALAHRPGEHPLFHYPPNA